MSESNLDFWNSVEKTNPKHTKKVKAGGRSITAINAQQQIKNATEKWGMYGKTWGLKSIKDPEYINGLANNQILAVTNAVFFYPEGEFPIGSSILVQSWIKSSSYNKVDDDFLKKLETDMTTKALSKLGFNADVFLGRYDDNKYVAQITQEFNKIELIKGDNKYWKNIEVAIKDGKIKNIDQIKAVYNVSNETIEKLNLLLK